MSRRRAEEGLLESAFLAVILVLGMLAARKFDGLADTQSVDRQDLVRRVEALIGKWEKQ